MEMSAHHTLSALQGLGDSALNETGARPQAACLLEMQTGRRLPQHNTPGGLESGRGKPLRVT